MRFEDLHEDTYAALAEAIARATYVYFRDPEATAEWEDLAHRGRVIYREDAEAILTATWPLLAEAAVRQAVGEAVGVDAGRECCVEHEQLVIDDLLHTARADA